MRIIALLLFSILSAENAFFWSVRHLENGGVGFDTGYTSLTGLALHREKESCSFVDMRLHYTDDALFAGNLGLGRRVLLPRQNVVIGSYCYFDFRQASHHMFFTQVTAGLEAFIAEVDLRLNYYAPIRQQSCTNHTVWWYDGGYYIERRISDVSLQGFDFEAAFLKQQTAIADLYGAAGLYYLQGEVPENVFGVKGRLQAKLSTHLSAEMIYTYDRVFGSRVQGVIALTLPFNSFGMQAPYRNEMIALTSQSFWDWNY